MAYLNDLHVLIGGIVIDLYAPELVTGTATDDTITIYGGDNTVVALGGEDLILDVRAYNGGYSGMDTVLGGDGDDVIITSLDGSGNEYFGEAGADLINCIPNGNGVYVDLALGIARDRATLATSLVNGIENAIGTGMSDYIYGDTLNNRLFGNDGDDLLRGQAGRDELFGGRGRDVLFGGTQDDVLKGGEDADILYGEAGLDVLGGDAGNDILVGGTGKDTLIGGLGADRFAYRAQNESGISLATQDVIADFVHLQDKIDVRDIDAKVTVAGNQNFTFIGTAAFSAAGQVRFTLDAATQDTIILFNTDSDRAAEMSIRIDPLFAPTAADFIL